MMIGRVKSLAWLVILWALVLHGTFCARAGALWRDEANSIQQARLSTWHELWSSLEYDSFPILFPAALKLWSVRPWTASDSGLRFFGLIVGVAELFSFWAIARLLGSPVPVLGTVLFVSNALVIADGDSIRPYGLGLLFLIWTFGLMAKYLIEPARIWLVLCAITAVLSVQTSYSNLIYVGVFSLCAGGVSALNGLQDRSWRVF